MNRWLWSLTLILLSALIGMSPVHARLGILSKTRAQFLTAMLKGFLVAGLATPQGIGILENLSGQSLSDLPLWLPWALACAALVSSCWGPFKMNHDVRGMPVALGSLLVLSAWTAVAAVLVYVGVSEIAKRPAATARVSACLVAAGVEWVITPPGVDFALFCLMVFVLLLHHEQDLDSLLSTST